MVFEACGQFTEAMESFWDANDCDSYEWLKKACQEKYRNVIDKLRQITEHNATVKHAYFKLTPKQRNILTSIYQLEGSGPVTLTAISNVTKIRESELKKAIATFLRLNMLREDRYGYHLDENISIITKETLETNKKTSNREKANSKKFKVKIILKSGKEETGIVQDFADFKSLIQHFEKVRMEMDELITFEEFAFRASEVAMIEKVEEEAS
ncbi:hypothetical protein [Paenibacillus periandrae]|uniref:hypothetical protein n=1 Tax=Paenibacillus periandrae TaxID=1761741 RepID=UPI001F08F273|nr:hypothetical protein [Paenibacillus periandrae]